MPLLSQQVRPNSVSVTQRATNAGGANSVIVIQSSVSAQGPFAGSIPGGSTSNGQMNLTLADALQRGLRFNLGTVDETQAVLYARGQQTAARSALLPHLNAALSEELEKLNLRTQGVEAVTFPVTSTFNFFDARAARLQQSIFDLVKVDNLRSAGENVQANVKAARDARDLIVLAVAGGYLQLTATEARISAVQAEVNTAKAIAQQAQDSFTAGLAARIDATRSQVQLQTEEQRLFALDADLETQKLRMARMIGLPLDQKFAVAENYTFAPLTDLTPETALARAMQERSDLQSAQASVRAAQDAVNAARAERLPNLAVTADWGVAGLRPTQDARTVYAVAGTLTVPLYEGGRIRGEIQQATAVLNQRKAQLEDLRGQVEEDVRQAFIDLNAAAQQVSVANSNVALSQDALRQSRDRFAQGVADTVEVVQAEQAAVQAQDDYITAVYEHNLAKVALARAMGHAEQSLPQLLRK